MRVDWPDMTEDPVAPYLPRRGREWLRGGVPHASELGSQRAMIVVCGEAGEGIGPDIGMKEVPAKERGRVVGEGGSS